MNQKPNVLCVGFAKCGTTTLYDIMKQHSDIYLSGIKEPIYYGNKIIEEKGINWYKKRYYPKKVKEKVIMEINPVIGKYVNPKRIKKDYGKNTKIIFIIRNPIKRLYSNFVMNLKKGDCFNKIDENIGKENELFDKWIIDNFLNDKGNIINNEIVPQFCKSGNYYKIINDYINVFGRSNIKVIVFEDFIRNPELECKKIFDFIGVNIEQNINYNILSNEGNRIPYNKLSIKIIKKIFKIWENIIIKKIPYISYNFSNLLNNSMWKSSVLLSKKTTKKDISYCSKIILNNYYKDICNNLGKLLNVNLIDKWNINISEINKDDDIILKLKKKYNTDLIKIEKDYYKCSKKYKKDAFINVINFHRNIIIKIVKDVLDYFPELSNLQLVTLNGSFASKTNIFDSDLDLNIFHNNEDPIYLLYELRINYILSRVMNFKGCDRVHTIMNYTELNKKINYKVSDNNIIINDIYNCKCYFRENYETTLKEQILSSRDYNVFLYYIDNNIKKKYFSNWMNNFILVRDNGNYSLFQEEINKRLNYIKHKFSKDVVQKRIYDINILIKKILNYRLQNELNIRKLKKIHKNDIITSLLDLKFIINIFIDNKNTKIKLENELNEILYSQLYIIMRLKMILKEKGYDLSSHSSKNITKKEFIKISKSLFKEKNIFKKEKYNLKRILRITKELEVYYV